jgi:hypothetical protein
MPFEVVDEAAEKGEQREKLELVRQALETFGQKEFLGNVKVTAEATSFKFMWIVTSQIVKKPRFSWMRFISLLNPTSEPPIKVLEMTSEKTIGSGGTFELQNFEVRIVNRDLLSKVEKLADVLAIVCNAKNVKAYIVEEF